MSDELINQRQTKLKKIVELGLDPYPQPNLVNKTTCEAAKKSLGVTVTIAGRLMSLRGHGKILFTDLQDRTDKIQVFFQQKNLESTFDQTKLFDIGDIISATGTIITTSAGEITLDVSGFQILAKNLRPLPEKWHGLTDIEERYRQRYVDLITNPESRQVFLTRTKILTTMRRFLDEHGFIEVETPILQPVYGGASAKPFVTHHNELEQNMYLRISDELYLKRLIVGGFEKVYEVSKDFRNEGVSRFHNPEFTQIEFYWAYIDYDQLMKFTEELVAHVIQTVNGNHTVKFQDKELDFTPPFKRLTFRDAIEEKLNIDIDQIKTEEDFYTTIKSKNLKLDTSGAVGVGALLDTLYKEYVRPYLIGPVYITDYPSEMIALAKRKADNPSKIASFQLLACGTELLKAYNELNDPKDQRDRWLDEVALEKKGAENAMQMDDDYIRALEYGMPPTAGWGMGIDRFTQFITNSATIKDVILFPAMREAKSHSSAVMANIGTADSNIVYQISPEFLEKYPEVNTGIAILEGVEITKENSELEKEKKLIEEKYKNVNLEDVAKIPTIAAYRKFFKEFGVDPNSHYPSPDALLRRIVSGKSLYKINTLVDAYNVACLETNIGMSAMNLDKIKLPLSLRFSKSGEQVTLLGGDEVKTTDANQVVYSDQESIVTLDLNYRDCDRTKITEKTKSVLLTVDGCPGISKQEIEVALNKQIEIIQKYCGGKLILKKVGQSVSKPVEEKVGLQSPLVIIGQVTAINPHPNADKLKIFDVDCGDKGKFAIISGCTNVEVGSVVPVALVGAIVHAPENKTQKIKVSKMRGVESPAMMCSPLEVRLGDKSHTGIYLLDESLSTHLGEAVSKYIK